MQRVLAGDLHEHIGTTVVLQGWLHHQRQLARVSFVLLRDRSGVVQVVVEEEADRQSVGRLVAETVLELEGTVVANPQAPSGVEVQLDALRVLAEPEGPPPFDLRRSVIPAALPSLLDHAAVYLRHPARRAMTTLAAAAAHGFRATLDQLGFTEVYTPKVVGSATEGGANVFTLDWFGRPAYLAQSPQFYKQTLVGALERVYEVGPVFRAEAHDTARHLAEYVSLDVEMGFIRDHRDVMSVLREVLSGMVSATVERAASALQLLELQPPSVPADIPVVHFADAQELIQRATGETVVGEPDLAPAHERWLGEWARSEHGSDFLFVEGYPMAKRPFYTHPEPGRPGFSNSFDLLFRGLELVTGGQRLHHLADYVAALEGQDLGPLEGYLEAFRHGLPPHGGFAIGLERWVSRLVGAANVREVTLFPRDIHRLTP